MKRDEYDKNVFINCPFDPGYTPIFEAVVFAVNAAGFRLDSSEIGCTRSSKIGSCRYSIHDLSRTTLDEATSLPRFNMPLELGIDLGCKAFSPDCGDKSLLIFDSEQYRFQKFVSDIGGQDIHHHGNSAKTAVVSVRNWLRAESGKEMIPGGTTIFTNYEAFRTDLPRICSQLRLHPEELTFTDFSFTILTWLGTHP
jgi:hypothetical protein